MSASLTDILTAAKNAVVALNNATATYLNIRGVQVANGIAAATVAFGGVGRLGVLSVVSGTGGGMIYDSRAIGNTQLPICAIPATPGVYVIDIPFNNGLLVVPGTATVVTVSYATGGSVGQAGG